MSAFSELLQKRSDEMGVKQSEICEKTGISKQHVSSLFKGKRTPNFDCLTRLAAILDLHGAERQAFEDLAAIAHLPAEVQSRFVGILKSLQRAEATLKRQQADIDSLLDRVERYEARLKR